MSIAAVQAYQFCLPYYVYGCISIVLWTGVLCFFAFGVSWRWAVVRLYLLVFFSSGLLLRFHSRKLKRCLVNAEGFYLLALSSCALVSVWVAP